LIGLEYDITNFKEQYNKALELLDIEAEPLKVDAMQGEQYENNHSLKTNYEAFFQSAIENINNTNYAHKRGLSDEIIKTYKLGYVEEWQHPKLVKEGKNPPKTPRLIIPKDPFSYLARDTRNIDEIPQEQ